VKLSVEPGAGVWWFSLTFAGSRADEITKVELKDNGNFGTFKSMKNEWTDVWYFNPEAQGPLSFPITVKASLPSGSSVSFVVNGLPSKTVDSGALFA
jgi:hypothetical protein